MTPPTTLLDRVRLRLRSRRALERALAVAEADRDGARAVALGWQREARGAQAHASHWRRNVGELVGVQSEGRTDGELHRRLVRIVEDGGRAQDVADGARGETEAALNTVGDIAAAAGCPDAPARWNVVEIVGRVTAARDELEAVRDELRATGHPIGTRGLSYDVDAAIDRERSRAQDLVDRLGDVLGLDEYRASWPYSAPHLVREVAVRLGRPMPRRRVHPSDWTPGSRLARALACTCRGERGQGPTSIVDAHCPEHSPGYRFGGWPVQPLALPRAATGSPALVDAAAVAAHRDLIYALPSVRPGCVREHDESWDLEDVDGYALREIRAGHWHVVAGPGMCGWYCTGRPDDGMTWADVVGRMIRPRPAPVPPSRYGLDALDRLVGDGLAGEWVCDACGQPVGVLPCPEHQPRAYAEALAEVPF